MENDPSIQKLCFFSASVRFQRGHKSSFNTIAEGHNMSCYFRPTRFKYLPNRPCRIWDTQKDVVPLKKNAKHPDQHPPQDGRVSHICVDNSAGSPNNVRTVISDIHWAVLSTSSVFVILASVNRSNKSWQKQLTDHVPSLIVHSLSHDSRVNSHTRVI